MAMVFSRRNFLQAAGAGLLLQTRFLKAQQAPAGTLLQPLREFTGRSKVALIHGEDRRKNAYEALVAIDDQIRPRLHQKKYVIIKPNDTSTVNELASTHVDALRGILDYLAPRCRGEVVIAEAASGETSEAYENFRYTRLLSEYRSLKVSLVDLNKEARYEVASIIDRDLHAMPVRLAARLLDPDAFVISAAITKTHNDVVATMAVKNMVLGAPLHHAPGETPRWSDKPKFHSGVRQLNYNLLTTAQRMAANWGVALIDGFEGMEGNGPVSGTPVASRIAITSTDFIAADRVAVEAMGVNPDWVGYLRYCWQEGLGQYDLSKIAVLGPSIASVRRPYRLHADVERQLRWMGPLSEQPPTT